MARQQGRQASAKTVNRPKQAGFYVDRGGEEISSPQAVDVGDLAADIEQAAGVAEMLLITDHSRMEFETPDRYDTTTELQARLLPLSHPGVI